MLEFLPTILLGKSVKTEVTSRCRYHHFFPQKRPGWFIILGLLASTAVSAEDLSRIRNIISNAPENSWIKVNINNFSDVWVPEELRNPIDSFSGPSAIIRAWSSFAWDSNRGDLLLFGGGHANYAGNEVYRWRGSTQEWELASLPSKLDAQNIPVGGAAKGGPQSSHTYDNAIFLPIADRFMTLGGAAFQSGNHFEAKNADGTLRRTGPYFFDPSKADPNNVGGGDGTGVDPNSPGGNMWENRDIYVKPGFLPNGAPGSIEGTTDYALIDGKETIFISGVDGGGSEHRLSSLTITDYNDPNLDVWQDLGVNWDGSGGKGAGAYDPVNNIYIKTYGAANQFIFWDLDAPGLGNGNVRVNAEVPANFNMAGQYGFEYDPDRNRFLLWGGGNEVFQLNVGNKDGTNWVVSQLSPSSTGGVPAETVETGVLGKWHYAPDLGVFVGLEGPSEGNVWFYKPTAVASVPLSVGIANAGPDQSVESGDLVVLDGNPSSDFSNASTITYEWTQMSGQPVVLSDKFAQKPSFTAPSIAGPLEFSLKVNNGITQSAADIVVVNVASKSTGTGTPNTAPTVDAGPDLVVTEGAQVKLEGSATDKESIDLSHEWQQVSGTPVILTEIKKPNLTFTAPFIASGSETLEFRYTVTDSFPQALSGSDSVIVQVNNDDNLLDCSRAKPSKTFLWPATKGFVNIKIAGITGPTLSGKNPNYDLSIDGITQDEPLKNIALKDKTSPDAKIKKAKRTAKKSLAKDKIYLRAERQGIKPKNQPFSGNGRVYRVMFTAGDGIRSCTGTVKVQVPPKRNVESIEDDQAYNAIQK